MSLETSEVVVGGTGHIWRSPIGTAFPTDISVAVNDALWTELGYTDEDGVKVTHERNVQEIMGWQSMDPLRVLIQSVPKSIAFNLRQTNQNTWATAMGGGTWSTPGAGKYHYDPPADSFVDGMQLIVEWADGSLAYRLAYRNVINEAGIEFDVNRQDSIKFATTLKALASPTAGQASWFFDTNDANLGDYTQAGS